MNQLDGAEGLCRKKEDGGDERESAFDRDTQQTEGQQAEPDERIEDEGKERKRPADDKEDAEEEEFEHDVSGLGDDCIEVYAGRWVKVPGRWRCGQSR